MSADDDSLQRKSDLIADRPFCWLRPVRIDDFTYFDAELFNSETVGAYQWFGHRDPRAARREFEETGFLTRDGGRLTVEVGGEVAGRVAWRLARWGPVDAPHCWDLGMNIFTRFRGHGVGAAAGRALVSYLFDTTIVNRIQAYTDVENLPAQQMLETGGFLREGTLRGAQWRHGKWHDQCMYSLLRSEWERAIP